MNALLMNRAFRRVVAVALVPASIALVGCSTTSLDRPQPVTPTPTTAAYDEFGVVRNIALVDQRAGSTLPNLTGAAIGGVLGAVVGNQIGGGRGRTAATVAGAVGGALVGNEVQARNSAPAGGTPVYRVEVLTDGGNVRTFQYQDLSGVRVGDRVRIYNGQLYRG